MKKAVAASSNGPDASGPEPLPQPSTAAYASQTKAGLQRVKTDLSVPVYGIDGAISRLEKLAKTISSASQESLSQRVLTFAENERDEKYEKLVEAVVQYLYPSERVPADLRKILNDSVLFRYYRILYQRRRREKESTLDFSSYPGQKMVKDLVTRQNDNQPSTGPAPTSPTPQAQTQPSTQQDDKSEADTDAKSAPHSIDLDIFNDKIDQQSERISDQASSAPQTGKILYPKAPELSKEHGNAQCPICYTLLPKSKVEKKNWR